MSNRTIQVFEHERLTTEDGAYSRSGFTPELLKSLQLYHSRFQKNPPFELIHKGVKFSSHVGVIQVGSTLIEILPKIDKQTEEASVWRDVLIHMLVRAQYVQVNYTENAQLRYKPLSLLEVYFELYINELERLLHAGLIKKYTRRLQNRTSLKGAIDFPSHLSANLIRRDLFSTRAEHYDREHLLHDILFAGLEIVQLMDKGVLNDRIQRLKLDWPEAQVRRIGSSHFDQIAFNRKSAAYREAIEMARMFILGLRPDIKSGRENLLALLFDMNQLWERFIVYELRKALPLGWQIQTQSSKAFWRGMNTTAYLRPDIILENNEKGIRIVLDTKWKLVEDSRPSDADLKQMFTYCHLFESEQAYLVYPGSGNFTRQSGVFSTQEGALTCGLILAEVCSSGGLNKCLGTQLFGAIYSHEEQSVAEAP